MKKLSTILMFALAVTLGKAQWNPNTDQNLFVADPGNGASFSATTSDGKTYVGFWKQVGAPMNYELRLQILDQNGISQLGADGLLLSNQIPMGTFTVIQKTAVDSSNNLYIGVTGTGAGTPAYIFKITPQGTSVWPNGINIGDGYFPSILPLSNGDILVARAPATEPHMKIQRYNSSGQPVWANPINIVSDVATNKTAPADFYELPNNEVQVIFHKRVGFGTTSYLFAQKIDLNGNILWADGAKQISTQTTVYNTDYSGFADGNVVYYGYSSGQNNRYDSYLQKIEADGTLPWGVNGVDFDINQTYFEKNIRVAFAPGSQNIWAIATYTSTGQGQGGEYVQKFDKTTGNRLFTNNGKQVFPVTDQLMVHDGDLHLVDGKPFFVAQKRINTALLPYSLNAVLLNDSGDFAWTQQYIPMATFNASKSYTNVLKPINNRSIIVFQEQKTADPNKVIYAQSLVIPATNLGTSDIIKTKSIKLYPNPATEVIHLDGAENSSYAIYNAAGQLVKSGEISKGEIAVQELVKGQYILKLEGEQKGIKFIKK